MSIGCLSQMFMYCPQLDPLPEQSDPSCYYQFTSSSITIQRRNWRNETVQSEDHQLVQPPASFLCNLIMDDGTDDISSQRFQDLIINQSAHSTSSLVFTGKGTQNLIYPFNSPRWSNRRSSDYHIHWCLDIYIAPNIYNIPPQCSLLKTSLYNRTFI